MILIIGPFLDEPTIVSVKAALNLEDFLFKRNIPYRKLIGIAAYRPQFELTTLANDIDMICYFGHGEEDCLFGQHIFGKMCDLLNANLLKNKIIYTMACWSANKLGPFAIRKGALAYFGCKSWYFGAYPGRDYDYHVDWIDYVTIIPKRLAVGDTTSQALEMYKSTIEKYVHIYDKNSFMESDFYSYSTKENLENFALIGSKKARLFGYGR